MLGQIVGNYRVVRELGAGGMGTVYEAVHVQLGRKAAIKVLRPEFSKDAGVANRFFNEAKAVNIIQHPGIVAIFEFGSMDSGAAYLVMEFLDGELLTKRLERMGGKLAVADVVRFGKQMATTLSAAHAKAIVHRDMKPDNVMIVKDAELPGGERTKIMDFGIAKLQDPAAAGGAQTQAGLVLGTPTYMSPEQIRGATGVNDRADVYAFGCMMYQMVAGRPPFASPGLGELLTMHVLNPPPPLADAAPGTPPSLVALIHLMLAKEQNERPSMAQVAQRLGEIEPQLTPSPGPRAVNRADKATVQAMVAAPQETPAPVAVQQNRAAPQPAPQRAPSDRSLAATAGAGLKSLQQPQKPSSSMGAVIAVVGLLLAAGGGGAWFFLKGSGAPKGPTLRIHGSNTIGAELMPALVEGLLAKRGDTEVHRVPGATEELRIVGKKKSGGEESVEIAAHGSGSAFTDLATATCDVGMASRPITEKEGTDLAALGDMSSSDAEHIIGLDGVAVIVNKANAIESLELDQLSDIFTGKAKSWSDVGGGPGAIKIYFLDEKSATADLVKNLVLSGSKMAGDVHQPLYESAGTLSDDVAKDPLALGVVPLALVRDNKALGISDSGQQPLFPTKFTVTREDYPLSRRLFLYTPESTKSALAKELLDFALSPAGQKIVEDRGFVSLDVKAEPPADRCKGCPSDYLGLTRGAQQLSVNFRFAHKGNALDSRGQQDLQRMADYLAAHKADGKLVLLGFSDNQGSRDANKRLSKDRALLIAREFQTRGLPAADAFGFGPVMPVAKNTTPLGRARNNRVEVWLRPQ